MNSLNFKNLQTKFFANHFPLGIVYIRAMQKIPSAFLLLIIPLSLTAQAEDAPFRDEINRHRQQYKEEFLLEARAPIKGQDTALLDFFAPDLAWRVSARFEPTPDAKPFDMPTYSGLSTRYLEYRVQHVEVSG